MVWVVGMDFGHTIASSRWIVDGGFAVEGHMCGVVFLLDNFVGLPRHIAGVMIAAEKVVMWVIHVPCSKAIHLVQYTWVVLPRGKATEC